jgi:hypothetical protein
MRLLTTREVEELLGVPNWILRGLLQHRKMPPVGKNASGDFVWSPTDIENAKKALARPKLKGGRPRKSQPADVA